MNDTPESASASASAERVGWLGVAALLVALIALACAGFLFEQWRQERHKSEAVLIGSAQMLKRQQSEIRALSQTLQTLRGQMAELRRANAARDEQSQDNETLAEEIAQAREELLARQNAISADLATLDGKLAVLGASPAAQGWQTHLWILGERMRRGEAYDEALKALKSAYGEDTARVATPLSTLEEYARSGVQTPAQLYQAFTEITVAGDVPLPEEVSTDAPAEAASFKDRLLLGVRRWVRLERIAEDSSPFAALEEAQTLLKLGDVKAARDIVLEMPRSDREPFADWLEEAAAQRKAYAALEEIAAHPPHFASSPVAEATPPGGE